MNFVDHTVFVRFRNFGIFLEKHDEITDLKIIVTFEPLVLLHQFWDVVEQLCLKPGIVDVCVLFQ